MYLTIIKSTVSIRSIPLVIIGLLGLVLFVIGCEKTGEVETVYRTALADSLVAVVDQVSSAVADQRYPDFLVLVDPKERTELELMVARYGYSSLKAYLDQQMHGWPDTDTLRLADLIFDSTHARLTFEGKGSDWGRLPSVRYTILLFRQTPRGWRLSAMTSIEKDAIDRYGHRLTYHETDLPSKLRFPRPF